LYTLFLTSPSAYLKTPKSPSLDVLWLPILFPLHKLRALNPTWAVRPSMHAAYTVSDLQASFKSLTAKLGAAQSFATERQDDGAGHVEKNGSTFALVYTERGEEI
jgi:hypothetical protein